MFTLGDSLIWSATDLVTAARCEFALLSQVDRLLGRAPQDESPDDPLMAQIADLGKRHEAQALAAFEAELGVHDAARGTGVRRFEAVPGFSSAALEDAAQLTAEALTEGADVLHQPAFFDGEFFGYADFLRATPEGWVVVDAKLARQAQPTALLQLAAYSTAVTRAGGRVAPVVRLHLGDDRVLDFPREELEAVFRERRARIRALLVSHQAGVDPVRWDQPGILHCGSCADCERAAVAADDLVLVARLRMDQRRRLKSVGIHTMGDLAEAETGPSGMAGSTFAKLRAQARLQVQGAAEGETLHEVISQQALRSLPEPSPGDLFFDFEGDPLFNEGDPDRWGLEYLWGVLTSPDHPSQPRQFMPLWADDHTAEKDQLIAFLDDVVARLEVHPDLHIYHYAPYEVTALKRLAGVCETHESVVDDLLRRGVFVDLYATVRESVLISESSYSIKRLEPLYLSTPRGGEVTKGDASIAEYHDYCQLRDLGDASGAAVKRANLLDYNEIDCVSTLELRDWLRGLVEPVEDDGGTGGATGGRGGAADSGDSDDSAGGGESESEVDEALVALTDSLRSRAGAAPRPERTHEEQGWAMLASALGYHRRERLPEAWAHFNRLGEPVGSWRTSPDVVCFDDPPEVVDDWFKGPRKRTFTRVLTAVVDLPVGSAVGVASGMDSMYADPMPQELCPPENGVHAAGFGVTITAVEPEGERFRITFTETLKMQMDGHPELPLALIPGFGVNEKPLAEAIREVATEADRLGTLPAQPALDVLAKRGPRLTAGGAGGTLPDSGDKAADLTEALLSIDRSYLAVQGPPGTGKTYTGSEVITRLVRDHGWKVGVVAQSHAVVENFLAAVVKRGLDPTLIAKKPKPGSKAGTRPWQEKKDPAAFVEGTEGGCLVGSTAWAYAATSFPRDGLDLLVIDEAGQFSLANTIAVSVAAQRLLLLGDPQQLPQVSQGTHGEPVNRSALGWLMDGHHSLPAELGYFLADSYRMHPAVCAPVSELSYDGLLHSAPPASKRSIDGFAPGLEVVRISHQENRTSSVEEARVIVDRIRSVVGRLDWQDPEDPSTPRQLGRADVLVVAPYNAQRQLITQMLADAGLGDVKVGTVDKFQGQEAPVVFVSMTASSAADVPRGMDFLLLRNRINVAISRAQWRAVLVRSTALTSYLPGSTRGLVELGAFVRLCESGT
ncbi:TM0106 family RecB-like putative nuclease [Nocardioides sp. JQ2195]|uniref:bifunctional RecB family nuclease/DEAD/DEAH box helicase n=1 Tax=Nocardioides sp. JQ2195 TaxID=2592334 RepID=UPI00143E6853|nr:bifunctional RecB family nuclease/DEAD/DEAH box helicase [Nocardioides sp. JQ2195]QIX27927.1 TM0106 family RecB-like putative nuclease [Nocardioides sp. JQ2195]